MSSEWMKVMLDEIARKKAEAAQARIELELRTAEGVALEPAPGPNEPSEPPGVPTRE